MLDKGSRVRVIRDHVPESSDPYIVQTGEKVRLRRRSDEWPGWVWCTDSRCKGGWVPESYLTVKGQLIVMNRDYNARELAVKVGEQFAVEDAESGWLLLVSKLGQRGWVPARNVEPV